MQIQELKSIQNLGDFRLIAGRSGLQRQIDNAVILEYDNMSQKKYPGYYENDFVISSLTFAKNRPDLLFPTISRVFSLNAAGMAIKTAYYEELPQSVLDFADENGFPIFLFDKLYLEKVIISITEYIQKKNNLSLYSAELHQLLKQNLPDYTVKQYCAAMLPIFQGCMAAAYVHMQKKAKRGVNILEKIQINGKNTGANFRVLGYRQGIFIFHTCFNVIPKERMRIEICSALRSVGLAPSECQIGISNLHTREQHFDMCVRESYYAYVYGCVEKQPVSFYDDIGVYSFVFPNLRDKSCMRVYRERLGTLLDYDLQNNSCLLDTGQAFIRQDYDVQQTARALCQHPNTIRYRLHRINELWGELPDGLFKYTLFCISALFEIEQQAAG